MKFEGNGPRPTTWGCAVPARNAMQFKALFRENVKEKQSILPC
jgi:hypothetical protein